jgi:MFS family permease
MAMFGLGTLLLIASLTGRYGLAGAVASAGSVGYAISSPLVARLVDRFGQRRVLRPTVTIYAAATTAFVACAQLRAPPPAVLATGFLAGASMPSLGSMVRARWSRLLGDSPRLGTAYALESVVDEVIFVAGPAVATLLATEVQPAAGVVTAMALCVAGTLILAAQPGTEPAPHPVPPRAAAPAGARPGRGRTRRRAGGRLPSPGAGHAGARILLYRLHVRLGRPEHRGLRAGARAQAAGRVPARHLRARQRHRRDLVRLAVVAGAAGAPVRPDLVPDRRRVATFWAMPGLGALAPVLFCSGLAIAPTLIAGFSLIERQALPGRRTEGMTWLSSAVSVGVAAGSAVAGQIVDAGGARWGYAFAACCGGVAAAICLAGLGRLRAVRAGQAAQ